MLARRLQPQAAMEFDLGLTLLRATVGLVFAAHGAQKAFGWWDGPGPENWTRSMHSMRFEPAGFWAAVSILAELLGGIGLALGLLTPISAAVLAGHSVVIIARVHWSRGFWNQGSGYEYPLVLLVAAVAFTLAPSAGWSVDAAIGLPILADATIRAALLVIGLAGGLGVSLLTSPAHSQQPG